LIPAKELANPPVPAGGQLLSSGSTHFRPALTCINSGVAALV
jgi:hypothetical protein